MRNAKTEIPATEAEAQSCVFTVLFWLMKKKLFKRIKYRNKYRKDRRAECYAKLTDATKPSQYCATSSIKHFLSKKTDFEKRHVVYLLWLNTEQCNKVLLNYLHTN